MFPYLDKNQKIPMYGVCLIVGMIVSFLVALFLTKKEGKDKDQMLYGSIFAAIGGILGAKILSILTSINIIIQYKIDFVSIIKNGFVFYGGLIGGFFGYFIYCKAFKKDFFSMVDIAAVALPAGHAIGRIGCFCSGCCFGRPTDSFLGVIYTHPADLNCPIGIKLLPTQLFETGYNLIIFIILLFISLKFSTRKSTRTILYIYMYSICRFVNEFFRYDSVRGSLWIFSTSQWISIPDPSLDAKSWYLKGTVNNWTASSDWKLTVDPSNEKHYSIEGVSLKTSDKVKVWMQDGNVWKGVASDGYEGCTYTKDSDGNASPLADGVYTVNFYLDGQDDNFITFTSAE